MSWNKIDNLLIKIEAFYKKALWSELVIKAQHNDINGAEYLTPKEREKIRLQKERERMSEEAAKWIGKKDTETKVRVNTNAPAPKEVDLGIHPEIVHFIKGIKNINVSEKLFEIAELYKETVKNNESPTSLYKAIDNFLETTLVDEYSDYDQEDDLEPGTNPKDITPGQAAKLEGLNIEILLREIYADISRRTSSATESITSKPTDTDSPTPAPAPDPEGADDRVPEEGGGQDYDKPNMGTTVDPNDIGGKKPRADGGVPSLGVITIREPKDYVKDYEAQKNRYIEQLNDPSINDVIKNNIKENINVLNNLINVTENEAAMLKDGGIAWVVVPKTDASPRRRVPTDPEKRLEWESIKAKQKKLRTANNSIKTNIRKYIGLQKNVDLDQQIASTRSEKYKFLLNQKKELNELILKKDYNKSEEIEARRAFINYIRASAGNATDDEIDRFPDRVMGNLNPEIVAAHEKKIEEAAAKKIPFEIIDAERKKKYTQQRSEVRQTGDIKGIVLQFSQNYSSFLSDNKKLKENAYHSEPALTGYVKAFTQAYEIASINPSPENNQKVEIAKLALTNGIEEYKQKLLKVEEVKKMLEALVNNTSGRYSKPRTPWFWLDEIPEEKKMILHELISRISSVNMEFSRPMRWAEQLNLIVNNLNERLNPTKIRVAPTEEFGSQPESETSTQEEEYIEETPALKQMRLKGYMNKKKRKIILTQINKQAQDEPETISSISAEDATKKLFMELWDKSPTRLEGER